jgi:hypothetical protein
MKIWFQGATDRALMSPYIAKVEAHFKAVLEADSSFSFNTTTPPATTHPPPPPPPRKGPTGGISQVETGGVSPRRD